MLNSFTAVKTKFIERKSSSTMCTCIELWLLGEKKFGSARTLFLLAAYWNAESKTEFTNDSLNSPKIEKLNIDTLIIPQGLSIHEKNQSSKISCYCPFNSLRHFKKILLFFSVFFSFYNIFSASSLAYLNKKQFAASREKVPWKAELIFNSIFGWQGAAEGETAAT